MKIRKSLSAFVVTILVIAAIFHLRVWLFEKIVIGYPIEQGGDTKKDLLVDGLKRTYLVHLPPQYDEERSWPLVFLLHGAGGNGEMFKAVTNMNEVADQEGFVAVYPNGTGLFNYVLSWNAGECCNYVAPFGVNDVEFIDRLTDELKKDYAVDPDRIYVAGMSNGGMMAYRLGCSLTDQLAAIGVVAASLSLEDCRPSGPLPVIVFHGKKDNVISLDGDKSTSWLVKFFGLNLNSASDSLSFWVKNNACSGGSQRIKKGKIEKRLYLGCRKNADILLYIIDDAGHMWPGGKKSWFLSDRPSMEINASEAIWDFFAGHPKI
jgi:polyhydroxybutyrate depolymerase